MKEHNWLKSKGYLHITPQIDLTKRRDEVLKKVTNPRFVAKYAFFPLIHLILKERKYKKTGLPNPLRAHSYIDSEGKNVQTVKSRPLHYATHLDAIIFGYYAEQLQIAYEEKLKTVSGLSDSIIAYRKIPTGIDDSNKSTIHFAHEVFEEIKHRSSGEEDCVVLAFDIKSFFSTLDHDLLKKAWADLLNVSRLSEDHYNVFKAATQFSYIMRDDLRLTRRLKSGRKPPFDERKLAMIRNKFGIQSFFESPKDFRDTIKSGDLKVCKYPFRHQDSGKPIGIPQGLPISAILANLYLLEFDLKIYNLLVNQMGCYYRRYSDDIVVICHANQKDFVNEFVNNSILESNVKISNEKTEIFHFKHVNSGFHAKLQCFKISKDQINISSPFIYLGFQFDGSHALIKSANLSKFYRRMVFAVKRKAQRAMKIAELNDTKPIIYRRQLYKLYSALDLSNVKVHVRWKKLVKQENGEFRLKTGLKRKPIKSNYFGYARRAGGIMNEPKIERQTRNHQKIFNQAIQRALKS